MENKPTNGWDALVKIIEMVLVIPTFIILFLLMTPIGWLIILMLFVIFGKHTS